jgi:2,4-dienoyl-CoA reductase-like NADH-dependent reductase (Old Yellow Enzyme family)
MPGLFEPGRIGNLELENRFIRTASHEGLADRRGAPTDAQRRFYQNFVHGGIGLVITGYAGVMSSGRSALYRMTMIDSDDLVPTHRMLTEKIHEAGGKIVLQIAHCGRQTWSISTGESTLVAPSAIPCGFYKEMPRMLTEPEIHDVIAAFAAAAVRAQIAGYDGVQIHGAHGYLLSTFLNLHANKRQDKWGVSLENRFRIVGEILRAVRDAVGPDFPVLIKLNSFEKPSLGMKPQICVEVARLVEKTGCCNAIEISAGTNEDGFYMARGDLPMDAILGFLRPYCKMNSLFKSLLKLAAPVIGMLQPPFFEGYNLDTAAMAKRAISLPVITVGGMRSRSFMEAAIRDGKTDFVSMARPLLLEPDLPNKFKNGLSEKALCNNCNICVVATDTVSIRCHNEELILKAGN